MSAYTDLITSEHSDKERFAATVAVTTAPAVDEQVVLLGLAAGFDLDAAVGAQLDIVGEWVGIKRQIKTPLVGVYFSFDTAGVGFDEGYWKGPFDPDQGLTSLPDANYRLLLRATIALNQWDGTLQAAIDAIAPLFPDNAVYLQDNQDMSISVAVSGPTLDVVAAALLTGGYLALKPMAVRIKFYFTSAPPAPVFGFDADNTFIGGFDTGAWGQPTPAP